MPIGTELARPFMPTKDFELSKRFYEALGFEKVLDGEVAIFNVCSGGFILQRHFQEDWAGNFMMQLMVDDLDVWWSHIESLDLPNRFEESCFATVVRCHKRLPQSIGTEKSGSQGSVIVCDEFDDVLILRHSSISGETWALGVER